MDIAYDVGREIAKRDAVLICGGLGGVMEYASRGAKDNGGITVGIVPQDDYSKANAFCDIVICTGIGDSRDFIISYSSDGNIGRWGSRHFDRVVRWIYGQKDNGFNRKKRRYFRCVWRKVFG